MATFESAWKWEPDFFETGDTRPKGFAYKTDPLALVLMEKDNGKPNHEIAHSIRSMNTVVPNKQSYIKDALQIRKHYRNKLMMMALKGQKLSKFREDLRDFVESDNINYIREDFIPMIIKLPEFYEEDMMYETLKKECETDPEFYNMQRAVLGADLQLHPLSKHRRKVRAGDQENYYFTDKNRYLYHIALDPRNPCLHLFEREFRKNTVTLKGNVFSHIVKGTGVGYFHLESWEVQ